MQAKTSIHFFIAHIRHLTPNTPKLSENPNPLQCTAMFTANLQQKLQENKR